MINRTVIYYSPDGTSLDLSAYPWAISDIDGLYGTGVDVTTQSSPFQDGSTYIDSTLQEREIPVTIGYVGSFDLSAIQTARRNLQKVCNPKTNSVYGAVGHLDITEDGTLRRSYCRVDSVSMSKITQGTANECIVTFVGNDPYLYADAQETGNVSSVTKTFIFPFAFESTISFGSASVGGVIVTNDGDGPASVVITVAGPCTNPIITNQATGEFVGFDVVLDSGDTLTVNTGTSIVDINGVTAIQYLDIDSSFWKLIPGDNNIVFTESVGTTSAVCIVTWETPYVGF